MSVYFVPVNSSNFNTILATESISPGSFYEKRRFGSKRYFYNTANPHANVILGYNLIPEAKPLTGDEESFILHIGFGEEYFTNFKLLKSENGQSVYFCDETVYLNFCKPFFVFANVEDRNKAITRSLSSLEVKTLEKYFSRFYTCDELSRKVDSIEVDIAADEALFPLREECLIADETINHFKGLVYTNVISKFYQKNSNTLVLQNTVRTVNNAWSAYLSAVSYGQEREKQNKINHSKKQPINHKPIELEPPLLLLNKTIHDWLDVVYAHTESIPLSEKISALFNSRGISPEEAPSISKFLSYFPELKESFNKIAEVYTPTLDYEIKSVRDEINRIHRTSRYIGSSAIERNEEKLKNCFEKTIALKPEQPDNDVVDSSIEIDHFLSGRNEIAFLPAKSKFDEKQNKIYEFIINHLLKFNRSVIGEVGVDHTSNIVTSVGNIVTETCGEESVERIELLHFYQFINNKRFDFDITALKNPVLSNLCAFLMNHKSLESLLNYCERQSVTEYHIAFHYWGIFNGFAPLGKIYTKQLWNKEHESLVKKIDDHLRSQLEELLPYLKDLPTTDIVIDKVVTSLNQESSMELSFDDLLKPFRLDSEVRRFIPWIEKCVEAIVMSLSMEYEDMSSVESLQRSFESELYASKGKPKGFNMQMCNKVSSLMNYDLFNRLKKEKEKLST